MQNPDACPAGTQGHDGVGLPTDVGRVLAHDQRSQTDLLDEHRPAHHRGILPLCVVRPDLDGAAAVHEAEEVRAEECGPFTGGLSAV